MIFPLFNEATETVWIHRFKPVYCETFSYGIFDQLFKHFLSGDPFLVLKLAASLFFRGNRIFHDTPPIFRCPTHPVGLRIT